MVLEEFELYLDQPPPYDDKDKGLLPPAYEEVPPPPYEEPPSERKKIFQFIPRKIIKLKDRERRNESVSSVSSVSSITTTRMPTTDSTTSKKPRILKEKMSNSNSSSLLELILPKKETEEEKKVFHDRVSKQQEMYGLELLKKSHSEKSSIRHLLPHKSNKVGVWKENNSKVSSKVEEFNREHKTGAPRAQSETKTFKLMRTATGQPYLMKNTAEPDEFM